MFSQEFIDKIKTEAGLVDLVSEYTELKKVGPYTYQGHCPHRDHNDSTPSFRVFVKGYKNGKKVNEYDTWACMGCHQGKKSDNKAFKNYGSDCIAFIQWVEPAYKKWRDAALHLANKKHIPIPTEENDKIYKSNKIIAQSLMYNLYGEPYQYLKNRGLDIEDCDNWYVGFDGSKITFPLLDKYKNILGFTRRWLHPPEGANDKYRNSYNSKIFNKSMYLYGIHRLDDECDEIRITEGPMDVIMADKYGVKNIVATLGTSFTEGHVEMIKHYKKIPVFCMDGDPAGSKAIKKAIDLLAHNGIYSKILILPEGEDLCDISVRLKEDTEDYINLSSITYGNYLLNDTFTAYNSKITEVKLSYLKEMRDILKVVPSEDERLVLKGHIKNNMGIDI